uniref:Armadillo/beta-catenin repeat family protein n=1 Tax=Rhizophora mucronata TaxID=61149 RepID=A0A2P2KKY1_RHIMU
MPTTFTTRTVPAHRPRDLLPQLASPDREIKLKALREVKNQIIGNRTKKLSFLELGAVPAVASILSAALIEPDSRFGSDDASIACKISNDYTSNILVQSAAALGSFACGFDAGVRAVLEAGAFPHLIRLLSNHDDKVADAGARCLRMIYQSKQAPKYDFLKEKNVEFVVSLLSSDSENVTGLGASMITHSYVSNEEQMALCNAGVLKMLISLLDGSLCQRDASLESLAAVFKDNPQVISEFVRLESGKALGRIIDLAKDRYPRTRLLSCMCLIVIRNASTDHLQDIGIKTKLVHLLLELLDDSGQVGDEAPFVFSSLIAKKEDLQKLAFEANALHKFCNHLRKGQLPGKRLQGILLVLADLCSKLETCRSRFLSFQVLNLVADALTHDHADVRIAACICLKSVSRSIKNLCAGYYMNERLISPLVQLLDDPSVSIQVAALGTISNMLIDFTRSKASFVQCGGVKHLVQSSKSMDSTVRLNSLWALRNMVFLADHKCKEMIFLELTAPLLASLICDPEPLVQEHALGLVRNLVDGYISSVECVFAEDGVILDAVGRQLQATSKAEIGIQGMYVLTNVASGNEFHKEAVMRQLLLQVDNGSQSFIIKFLQSNNSSLRTAAVWTIVNLTFPSCPSAFSRFVNLRSVGIVSQIRNMVNDPCPDVKVANIYISISIPFEVS